MEDKQKETVSHVQETANENNQQDKDTQFATKLGAEIAVSVQRSFEEQIKASPYQITLHAQRNKLRANSRQKIVMPTPLMNLDNKPFIYPATFNMIQGKSGTHKSRLAETLCALLLCTTTSSDFLGFTVGDYRQKYSVIYIDTERGAAWEIPFAIQRIEELASVKDCNDLHFFTLKEVGREDRINYIKEAVTLIKRENGTKGLDRAIFVILDVLTDCLSDKNDSKDSNKLMDEINALCERENISFVGIIHENHGSDKATGHIGTYAEQKAANVISIGKTAIGTIQVDFKKTRFGRFDPFMITYNDTEGRKRLERCDTVQAPVQKSRKDVILDTLTELDFPLKSETLVAKLEPLGAGFKRVSILTTLREIVESKDTFLDKEDNLCYLISKGSSKHIVYEKEIF